ncbi:hypothetical protein C8R43DRAFT_905798 [Mycena crocata]|nr:hypothetical protein C8R43DRAFT_905798 [Mycena crocata]
MVLFSTPGELTWYQDDPNWRFRRLRQVFLDESVRADGLGDHLDDPRCSCCRADPTTATRLFKCSDCGVFLQCLQCVKERHAMQPLHVLKEWSRTFWKDITLQALEVVYQMGHGELPCVSPDHVIRSMVVIHVNGLHIIDFQYCGCDLSDYGLNIYQCMRNLWYPATLVEPATCATFETLELFRLLNVVGNMNVHDFVGSLERLTDATRIKRVPDRYKSFGRMSRQWAFLKRCKRAGHAHDPAGLEATKNNGACAVLCWACPHDGINLPEGWRDVDPEFRFLYMLMLAVDANFRLKNRLRKNEHDDPSFGPGYGNIVEEEPYREHLVDYVSTCIAFAALLQKDTRSSSGLRCSGVGGVVCARHEVIRPLGMGDLQKGERYANMDYIVLSALLGMSLLWLTISYDIACQWQINLPTRMKEMPKHLQLPSDVEIQFGLPVWHAAAHEASCQAQNSLTYLEGVGRTDGEGIERTWSGLNPAAWSTKEMGKGARHDALEDRMDHHNWEKNISQGDTLARKLAVAMAERDRQVAAFVDVDSSLDAKLKEQWQKRITVWMADHTKPNPYEMDGRRRTGPSEAAVRLALKKDELEENEDAEDGATIHCQGATAFLVAGMQLEILQDRIKAESKGCALLQADLEGLVEELRVNFLGKLQTFRDLQGRHMPAAARRLEREEEERDCDAIPDLPENVKLWMPSELTECQRLKGCTKGLGAKEAALRESQCTNALDVLRDRLHAKCHLLIEQNSHVVGQKGTTRSHTLIEQIGERIHGVAVKYRRGQSALKVLKGEQYCESKRLLDLGADVRLDEEQEEDAKARLRLNKIGTKKGRHWNEPNLSSSKKKFSWIWTASGGPGADKDGMHDCELAAVYLEPRKNQWVEEVLLLREEMRRVMRYLRWRAAWWERRRDSRGTDMSRQVRSGLAAYVMRQAALHRAIARRFKTGWDTSRSNVVRMAAFEDAQMLEEGMRSLMAAEEAYKGPITAFEGGEAMVEEV